MIFRKGTKVKYAGFTLLEVLIALAVLGLGLGTVIKVASVQSGQTAYLKNKTIALWVAENKVNEIKLKGWPETGVSSGREKMLNNEWRWKVKVSSTPDKDLRRLDVEVGQGDQDDEALVKFIAFTGK